MQGRSRFELAVGAVRVVAALYMWVRGRRRDFGAVFDSQCGNRGAYEKVVYLMGMISAFFSVIPRPVC